MVEFLTRKWQRELDYKLRKYYFAHTDNRIAVCFEYEYHDKGKPEAAGIIPG